MAMGDDRMRVVLTTALALGLSVGVCASAQAAASHRANLRHAAVHRGPHAVRAAPAAPIDPRFPPVLEDQTPRYDDPSKFGGG
jgi:hypothetical protein